MAIKKPIPISFNLDGQHSVQSVCAVIHIDDNNTETLDLSLMQGGEHIAISPNSTVTARFVRVKDKILISDNVPCAVQENGNIYIPIDNAAAHMLVGEIKIEVNIVDENDILTMQFPLVIKVNNTILADAEISPESEGTIPELLEEAREAAEDAAQAAEAATEAISTKQDKLTAGDNITISEENVISASSGSNDYTELENKPSINNVTLSGNKSSGDLNLQDKLTAGQNITIEGNVISAEGGVTDYNELENKPIIRVFKRGADSSSWNDLRGILDFEHFDFEYIGVEGDIGIKLTDKVFKSHTNTFLGWAYDFNTFASEYAISSVFLVMNSRIRKLPSAFTYFDKSNSARSYIFHYFDPTFKTGVTVPIIRQVIYIDTNGDTRTFVQLANATKKSDGSYSVSNTNGWLELSSGGSQIVSGVVNANGTITFTDSEGNSFTTSGESVIGADGFSPSATVQQTASGATVSITDKNGTTTANISNGTPGQDYVLSAQDKTDIANIVLSELPTTEGVLYGNQSN